MQGSGVLRPGVYKWLNAGVSQRDFDDAHVIKVLHDIHRDDPTLGYRFLTDELEKVGIIASESRRIGCGGSAAGIFASHHRRKGKTGKPGRRSTTTCWLWSMARVVSPMSSPPRDATRSG